MATKTVTCCDITRKVCNQIFRIGIHDGSSQYTLEIGEQGMQMLLGKLISNVNPDELNDILVQLIGPNWKETLNQQM